VPAVFQATGGQQPNPLDERCGVHGASVAEAGMDAYGSIRPASALRMCGMISLLLNDEIKRGTLLRQIERLGQRGSWTVAVPVAPSSGVEPD
jgi:hypothetical protein